MALRVPGVLVRIINDTGVIAPPLYERYPVIIGEGDPYKLVENVQISRTVGSVDPIPTISTVFEIVSVGDISTDMPTYIDGVDYTLFGNNISWLPGGSSPTLGENYYISWTETRASSAYVPTLYFDTNLIYEDHGWQTRTNGNINDVSVGGAIALQAGANGVIIAQLDLSNAATPDSPSVAELENAFIATRDLLDEITDYKLFLVPMSSGTLSTTSAASIFFNHAVIASQPENKQERTVLAALAKSTSYTAAATYAQNYAHERMVVPYVKNSTVYVTGVPDQTGTYDMRFYNASLAGKLCSTPIGRTIADEILPGIKFDNNFKPAEAKYLVQRGVSPGKIRGEVVYNIMAITTDTTNALTEDLGVQDVKDYVKKYWREGLWAVYKNAPINAGLIGVMTDSSIGIMINLQNSVVISDYRNITVRQDTTEPRKILVAGKVLPAFCTTWIDVTFNFVLSFSS